MDEWRYQIFFNGSEACFLGIGKNVSVFLNIFKRMKFCCAFTIFLFVSLGFVQAQKAAPDKVAIGYLTAFKSSAYNVDKIPFQNLTHIIQSFLCPVAPDNPTLRYNGSDSAFLRMNLAEKTFFGWAKELIQAAHRQKVKVILGISGKGGVHATDLKAIFANEGLQKTFISNLLAVCNEYGYDGIDLDYEYPEAKQDGDNITKFVADLYAAVNQQAGLRRKGFTITLAVPKFDNYGQWFDFATLSKYCNWFNVMTYAYEASFTKLAGHNCPLYTEPAAEAAGKPGSVHRTMWEYFHVQRGVPLDKLVVGLGFYGWVHNDYTKLYGSKNSSVGITYADVEKSYLDQPGWTFYWSDIAKVPYLVNHSLNKMVTYDDAKSIGIKCDYAWEKGSGA